MVHVFTVKWEVFSVSQQVLQPVWRIFLQTQISLWDKSQQNVSMSWEVSETLYHKNIRNCDTRKNAVIILKFAHNGFTIK